MPTMSIKHWSAEPSVLGTSTDIVLRCMLPNGGRYCHRYAISPVGERLPQLKTAVPSMDGTLTMLLERGFFE